MISNLDPYGELCLAVGTLILDFAKLENAVSAGLRLHLCFRLEPMGEIDSLAVAAAVYGSLRLKTSTMLMRRLMVQERAGQARVDLFDAVFAHVGHINTLRDKFAHQSLSRASDDDGHWKLSDILTTRALDNQLNYEIRTSDVADASHDLREAFEIIRYFLEYPGIEPDDLPQVPAWKYKPASLRLVRPERGRAPQQRKPPPRSSRASQ